MDDVTRSTHGPYRDGERVDADDFAGIDAPSPHLLVLAKRGAG